MKMVRFPPLAANHPLVTEEVACAGCDVAFQPGEITTLIVIGPGKDRASRALCREGKAYRGRAVTVHWACATGEEE